MEVAVAPANPSYYLSAPSSPRPFGDPAGYDYFYTSAPASPSRIAAIYPDFYDGWEEKPVSPKPGGREDVDVDAEASDFAFCFHGQSEGEWPTPALAAADDLFEGGKIRPSMPSSVKNGREEHSTSSSVTTMKEASSRERGRAVSSTSSSASTGRRRGSRSLSPLRGREGDFQKPPSSSSSPPPANPTSTLSKCGGSKKWKFKDLFLFRSASEGRATGRGSKDPLRKYTIPPSSSSSSSSMFNKQIDDGGSTRRGAANLMSAHGMYYSANRASSEELKKKTPLPYHRHTLFGYLRYNPAIHSIKKGFGSSLFSRRQP